MNVIECDGLSKLYGKGKALHQLSFDIEENKITGLIGRNGAGKTTLLKLLAGYFRKTSGEMRVFGEQPFNNIKISANTICIDETMTFPAGLTLNELLDAAQSFYVNWNMELAQRLMEYFALHPKLYHSSLSKGMRSTFHLIIGLSARCALTILDEPTTGMDSAVRKDFYKAILNEYMAYPRTIILSSHLLNEIDDLIEDVLLIHHGEKVFHQSVDHLKELVIGLKGKTEILHKLTQNHKTYHTESFGKDSSFMVVENDFSGQLLQQAIIAGIEVTAVETDDICVYLTSNSKGGISDVFKRT